MDYVWVSPLCSSSNLDEESNTSNPLVSHDDKFEWPDLFSEADEMIAANVIIYPLAELHKFVKDGVAVVGPSVKAMPLPCRSLRKTIMANRRTIEACGLNKELNLMIMQTTDERKLAAALEEGTNDISFDNDSGGSQVELFAFREDGDNSVMPFMSSENSFSQHPLADSKIIVYNDQFASQGVVFMVKVSPGRKRLTFVFRGPVDSDQWLPDTLTPMKDIPNPLLSRQANLRTLKIHEYFHDCLYMPDVTAVQDYRRHERLLVYQQILRDHVYPLARSYPDHKIYISGYSAGGALATLFAFEAAAQPDSLVPKPVSLVTFGSPCVGDEGFRQSFSLLESLGKLRHLRVSNENDHVTNIPTIPFRWSCDPSSHLGGVFNHTGMHLRLPLGNVPVKVVYSTNDDHGMSIWNGMLRGWAQTILSSFPWIQQESLMLSEHNLQVYNERLYSRRVSIQRLDLNKMYKKCDAVGKLVPQV